MARTCSCWPTAADKERTLCALRSVTGSRLVRERRLPRPRRTADDDRGRTLHERILQVPCYRALRRVSVRMSLAGEALRGHAELIPFGVLHDRPAVLADGMPSHDGGAERYEPLDRCRVGVDEVEMDPI